VVQQVGTVAYSWMGGAFCAGLLLPAAGDEQGRIGGNSGIDDIHF